MKKKTLLRKKYLENFYSTDSFIYFWKFRNQQNIKILEIHRKLLTDLILTLLFTFGGLRSEKSSTTISQLPTFRPVLGHLQGNDTARTVVETIKGHI